VSVAICAAKCGDDPETELLLFEASRTQLVREVIKPALESGQCVIADRFFDPRPFIKGSPANWTANCPAIERVRRRALRSDITFLLDVDLKTAQSRMRQPRRPDRMEQELGRVLRAVRDGYLELRMAARPSCRHRGLEIVV